MLESKKTKNVCSVCNGTGLRSRKPKKIHLNPVDLCSNCGGVGSLRVNEAVSENKGLSKNAIIGLSVLGVLSLGAVALFLTRKGNDGTPSSGDTSLSVDTPSAVDVPSESASQVFKPSETKSPVGVEMLSLPSGTFNMGGINDEVRAENIETPFLLGKTAVTQELYEGVMGKNPSNFKDPKKPVDSISFDAAIEFCNELSAREALEPCYTRSASVWVCAFDKNGYRLPTSKEWEYAAKAGTENKWAGTDNENGLDQYAWYDKNSAKTTHPVGTKLPNEWGFYDMSGNVYEWCWDLWDPTKNDLRVIRGGSYNNDAKDCLVSNYRMMDTAFEFDHQGFRLCRTSV